MSHANAAKDTGESLSPDIADAATISAEYGFQLSQNTRALCKEGSGATYRCYSHVRLNNNGTPFATSGPQQGYTPADIQSAYQIPASSAAVTVAVVDAYGYTNAESDLQVFRNQFGLPTCTTANGCFKKVNQNGQASPLPTETSSGDNPDWVGETALDLDAVSAACPACKILLVEAANDTTENNLLTAINGAVTAGAVVVSNSWGYPEASADTQSNSTYLNHAGVSILAAGGDHGYAPSFPADSPNVTSIGGTALVKASNARGWTETVWNDGIDSQDEEFWGTGSACSGNETKPSYQSGVTTGCSKRATNDISAQADLSDASPGLAVYCTGGGNTGWEPIGGTSLASPLVAGIVAATGKAGVGPDYFYSHTNELFDITSGNDLAAQNSGGFVSTCPDAPELCTAQAGWDGPTGWGTPNASLWTAGSSTGGSTGGTTGGTTGSSTGNSTGSSTGSSTGGSTGSSTGSSNGGSSGSSTGTQPPPPPAPTSTETEPNNSQSTANLLTAGVPLTGAVSSKSDVDYFRIQVAKGASIDLVLNGLSADLDLRLYNSSGKLVAISDNSGTEEEEIGGTVSNTVYYAKVSGYSGAKSSYTLTLTVN